MMFFGDLTSENESSVKSMIGYSEEPTQLCKNCKYFEFRREDMPLSLDPFRENHGAPRCKIAANLGYLTVKPDATCNKFAKRS